MQPIKRRTLLQWIGAAFAVAALRPFRATAGLLPVAPADPVMQLLRTEDFEEGRVEMASVDSPALAAMLRELHARYEYDASCHDGQPGPHSEYLAQWIVHVTGELRSRGHSLSM